MQQFNSRNDLTIQNVVQFIEQQTNDTDYIDIVNCVNNISDILTLTTQQLQEDNSVLEQITFKYIEVKYYYELLLDKFQNHFNKQLTYASLFDLIDVIFYDLNKTQRILTVTDSEQNKVIIQSILELSNLPDENFIVTYIINQINQITQLKQVNMSLNSQIKQIQLKLDKQVAQMDKLQFNFTNEPLMIENLSENPIKNDLQVQTQEISEKLQLNYNLEKVHYNLITKYENSKRKIKIFTYQQLQNQKSLITVLQDINNIKQELLSFKKVIQQSSSIQFEAQQQVVNLFIKQFTVLYHQNQNFKSTTQNLQQLTQTLQEQFSQKSKDYENVNNQNSRLAIKLKEKQSMLELNDLDIEQYIEQIQLHQSDLVKQKKQIIEQEQENKQQQLDIKHLKETLEEHTEKIQQFNSITQENVKLTNQQKQQTSQIIDLTNQIEMLQLVNLQQSESAINTQLTISEQKQKIASLHLEITDMQTNKNSSLEQFCAHFKINSSEIYEHYQTLLTKQKQQITKLAQLEIQLCQHKTDLVASRDLTLQLNKELQTEPEIIAKTTQETAKIPDEIFILNEKNHEIQELNLQISYLKNDISACQEEMKFKQKMYKEKLDKLDSGEKDGVIEQLNLKILEVEKQKSFWEKRARMLEKPKQSVVKSVVNKTLVK